jgi:hypothetical protein
VGRSTVAVLLYMRPFAIGGQAAYSVPSMKFELCAPTLESIVASFRAGATAEEIAQRFPAVAPFRLNWRPCSSDCSPQRYPSQLADDSALVDENFDHDLVRGVLRRRPELDLVALR